MRIKRVGSDVGDKIASMAIWFLGLGVVLAIWGGVWLVYLYRNPPDREVMAFFATGLFLTGADLLAIGFLSGRIGRSSQDQPDGVEAQPERIAIATPKTDHPH